MKIHTHTSTPDAALLSTVEELLASADRGQLAAEATVLAALFGLAAPHFEGAPREKCLELSTWYSEEAADGDLGGPACRFDLSRPRAS